MAEYLRKGAEKIILIAPTTGLVDQQKSMAQQYLNIPNEEIVSYTGDTAPDKRKVLWMQARVLMATPQVVRNDAQNGTIDLKKVALLVVDEAHHSTGNHAYAQVGKMYQRMNQTGRVLAATASPGSNIHHIGEVKQNLRVHQIDVSKRNEPLVKPFDVDMKIHEENVHLPPELTALIAPLEEHFSSEVKHLQRLGFLAPREHISSGDIEKAQLRASKAIQQRDVRGYDAARRVADLRRMHMLINLMKTQGTEVAASFLNRAETEGREGRKTNRLLSLPTIHELRKALKDIEELHPKPSIVARLVHDEILKKPEGKVLIFTEFRDTVSTLVKRLESIEGLKPDKFIGQSSRGKQKGMTQKQQLAQLNRFREGEINVLVATSVGEEGLDVPAADLVVLYEPVPSAIRAIQRRGRTARQRAGSVHVLIAQGTRDVFIHSASKNQEQKMHRLLNKMVAQKDLFTNYNILEGLLDYFKVETDGKSEPAASFLKRERELYKETEEVSKKSDQSKLDKVPDHVHKIAPPLTAKQRRPRTQMGLDAFMAPSVEHQETTSDGIGTDNIAIVLNAAEQEILSMNSVSGEGYEILVDHREINSTLPSYLTGLGFKTRLTHLPYGDVRLSERILIERKTARDLLASIKDGRLLSQCRSLQASSSRPLLLIETGGDTGYALHPNSILGALAHITLDLGIPVMMTKDAKESAHFIAIAARREQDILRAFHGLIGPNKTPEARLEEVMGEVRKEIETIGEDNAASHPWLDGMKERVKRCFELTMSKMDLIQLDEREVMVAFSPDLGTLFTASQELIMERGGCNEELAQRILSLLKANDSLMSR